MNNVSFLGTPYCNLRGIHTKLPEFYFKRNDIWITAYCTYNDKEAALFYYCSVESNSAVLYQIYSEDIPSHLSLSDEELPQTIVTRIQESEEIINEIGRLLAFLENK